jgi:hypothetical protein
MNTEELRAALDAAKTYKAERIAESEAEIRDMQSRLEAARVQLEAWRVMIPADVMRVMQEEVQREADNSEDAARTRALEASHTAALKEAFSKGKGILPPDGYTKSTWFGLVGAGFFGLCSALVGWCVFGIQPSYWLVAIGTLGGVLGLFAGFAVFDANFVIDESLEPRSFTKFTAHDTVRQTYFKR